ncbi:MAG TPA: Rieske (2Fe-2S) protein [Stellaceae bacterium]|nr:Rieske (2Fe-2S) protein [Stellaceae bacterium]
MSADEPLPAALYTRPEAFQRERRSVFASAWLLLARARAVQRPGDYVAHSLGGWPVFAIAGAGGAPRAFRNVCRHQKLPLFDGGVGHCEQIRCRYHGWTYDIAGRFAAAPPQVAPCDDLSHDLERVAAEQLHGLLFVHLDESPPPLVETMPALAAALAEAKLESLEFRTETTTDIDANWKLVMEQALADRSRDVARTAAWPCLILDASAGGAVLHQVIARSFHRTRIHHHHYGSHAAVEQAAAQVAQWKAGAVARNAALEAGATATQPESSELESFRSRVRSAHADGPPA